MPEIQVRPQHSLGEFVPVLQEPTSDNDEEDEGTQADDDGPEMPSSDGNTPREVELSFLCDKCEPIRDWVREHYLSMLSEHRVHGKWALRQLDKWEAGEHHSFGHYATVELLRQSQLSGCHFCTFIWTAFEMDADCNLANNVTEFRDKHLEEYDPFEREVGSWVGSPEDSAENSSEDWITDSSASAVDFEDLGDFKVFVHPYDCSAQDSMFMPKSLRTDSSLVLRRGIFGAVTVSGVTATGVSLESYPIFIRSVKHDLFMSNFGSKSAAGTCSAGSDAASDDSDSSWDECGGLVDRSSVAALTSPISTRSTSTTKLILSWLESCLKDHPKCHPERPVELPTRLLQVGPGKDHVRLVSTKDPDFANAGDTRYAVLSYCWGTHETFQLTGETHEDLLAGLPTYVLPQTIRDAVTVTHSLNLSWLWVDALCIIQDSLSDWDREARRMSAVYQGAHISIAALGAASSLEGLFSIRDPLRYSFLHLFQSEDHGWIDVCPPWMTEDTVDEVRPLEGRGWVVQERILAPRTVRFGSYLSWECRQCQRDEFGIDRNTPAIVKPFFASLARKTERHEGERGEKISRVWHRILAEYAKAQLTVRSDRLMAVSAVIDVIGRATGWANYAGLWEPFLLTELLWNPVWPQAREPMSTGVAPTWSWAGLDCELALDIIQDTSTSNLTILADAKFELEPSSHWQQSQGGVSELGVWLSYPPLNPQSNDLKLIDTVEQWHLDALVPGWPKLASRDFRFDRDAEDPGPVTVVPLVCSHTFANMHALVVKMSKERPGTYERVGTVTWMYISTVESKMALAYMQKARREGRLRRILVL